MSFNDPNASFKALFWFKDGNKGTFYSRDFAFNGSKRVRNPELGMSRLLRLIHGKFKGTYDTALICENKTGKKIDKYVNGERRPIHEE